MAMTGGREATGHGGHGNVGRRATSGGHKAVGLTAQVVDLGGNRQGARQVSPAMRNRFGQLRKLRL